MSTYQAIDALELLRLEHKPKVTQRQMAQHFGKSDRETVRAWELGQVVPSEKLYREKFVRYLLDRLSLHSKPARFRKIWDEVMVNRWQWEPLSRGDLSHYPEIAKYINTASSTATLVPPPLNHHLVGRSDLLSSLVARLQQMPYVALYGKPGVGKTDMLLRLAHDKTVQSHFFDGILWANLGVPMEFLDLTDDEVILSEQGKWAVALGMNVNDFARLHSLKARMDALRHAIGRRRMLMIVDDVWQLRMAQAFMVGGPRCTYVITTRIPNIAMDFAPHGATEILELDNIDGLDLLKQYAPFLPLEVLQDAERLVEEVGSLPLALVIMGQYLKRMSTSKHVELIANTIRELHDAKIRLTLGDEQNIAMPYPSIPLATPITLKAVIGISERALSDEERKALQILCLLSPKPNSFSDEAAVSITYQSAALINSLCQSGLLEVQRIGRFSIHPTIVDYFREKPLDQIMYDGIIEYFTNYVAVNERDHQLVETEENNVLTALQYALRLEKWKHLIRGANALHHYLDTRGLHRHALTLLEPAERQARLLKDNYDLMVTLRSLGVIHYHKGEYQIAKERFEEGLTLARLQMNLQYESMMLQFLGAIADNLGNSREAQQLYEAALPLAKAINDEARIAGLLQNIGVVLDSHGDFDKAKHYYVEALDLTRKIGNKIKIAPLLMNLGAIEYDIGNYPEAENYFNEALLLTQETKHNEGYITALEHLGMVAGKRADYQTEKELYEQALNLAYATEEYESILYLLSNLSDVAAILGDASLAEKYLRDGLQLARASGYQERICAFLERLGPFAVKKNEMQDAYSYLTEALQIARTIDNPVRICNALNAWGELYYKQMQFDLAKKAFGESLSLAQSCKLKEQADEALAGLAKF